MKKIIMLFILFLSPYIFTAEEDKALEERIKKQRSDAEQKTLENEVGEVKKELLKRAREQRAKDQQKKDLIEFKQKTLDNLGLIKEMFAKADEAWKNEKFKEASLLYLSVNQATVPGAEEMVAASRNRLIELEDLAKIHLVAADDADIKRDYLQEIKELDLIVREFAITKTKEIAQRRLMNLKSRPEIACYIELNEAEALEIDGKKEAALKIYTRIAENPRYENTVPALKAKKKLRENQ